jgi:hypothetical protein
LKPTLARSGIGALLLAIALGLGVVTHVRAAVPTVYFGVGLALSADQNTLLVEDEGTASASVYVRWGSTWKQQATLRSGEEPDGAALRRPLALSAAGNVAVIGARTSRRSSTTLAVRAAWVFVRVGARWKRQAQILPPRDDGGSPSEFGSSVAISGDGRTIVIGDPSDRKESGAAWAFTRYGSGWVRQGAKLTPNGAKGPGRFGATLSLSRDGNTALIGATDDDPETGLFQQPKGAAYVFTRSGMRWSQHGPKLVGQGNVYRYFGATVALSADGDRALIAGGGAVAAWAFARIGSTWVPESPWMLTPSHGIGRDDWAGHVALAPDGDTALLSGSFTSGSGVTTRMYRRTARGWAQSPARLDATPFGDAVVWRSRPVGR